MRTWASFPIILPRLQNIRSKSTTAVWELRYRLSQILSIRVKLLSQPPSATYPNAQLLNNRPTFLLWAHQTWILKSVWRTIQVNSYVFIFSSFIQLNMKKPPSMFRMLWQRRRKTTWVWSITKVIQPGYKTDYIDWEQDDLFLWLKLNMYVFLVQNRWNILIWSSRSHKYMVALFN